MDKRYIANRVSVISIIVNIALSAIKIVAGIIAHSTALISDAVHSMSDIVSTFAVIAGVNMGEREADKEHQYGHERIESVFSIVLSMLLFLTGAGIGMAAIKSIITSSYKTTELPGILALIAALISIAVKEWMYHYTIRAAKRTSSTALKADAWHHRSDALSSVGSFAGVLFARMGYPICDPIAGIIICLFIIKAAWDVFIEAINQIVDKSADEKTYDEILRLVLFQEGVIAVDSLKTRLFGSRMYVDVEIACDGEMTLYEAHTIAETVHDKIEEAFPDIKHCMVHVNPK